MELEKRRSSLEEKIAKGITVVTVLTGAGLAIQHHVKYQEPLSPSGIVRDIRSIPLTLIEDYNFLLRKVHPKPAPIVPEAFDKKADAIVIKAGVNAVPISEDEFVSLSKDAIKPLETGKFPEASIISPIKLSEGQSVDVETYWVDGAWNPIDQKSDRLAYGKTFKIAKKGTEIIPSKTGRISISTRSINGQQYLDSLSSSFKGPDDIRYNVAFTWDKDVRQLRPTEIIEQALKDGKNSIDLSATTTIAITDRDDVELNVSMFAYSPEYPKGLPVPFTLIEKIVDGRSVAVFVPQETPKK